MQSNESSAKVDEPVATENSDAAPAEASVDAVNGKIPPTKVTSYAVMADAYINLGLIVVINVHVVDSPTSSGRCYIDRKNCTYYWE